MLWECSENYDTHDAHECERCNGAGTLEEEPSVRDHGIDEIPF